MTEGSPTAPPPPSTPGGPGDGPTRAKRSFGERLLGALRLDASVYDEIEHDESALPQAAGVVALAAVASAIGGAVGGIGGALAGLVGAFIGWLLSTAVVWLIGVRFMHHTSDYMELLRTLGFASAPQILMVLAGIPLLGALVSVVVFAWGLAAFVVAVRQALDVETGRAILVCVLAWGAWLILTALLIGVFGRPTGPSPMVG